MIARETGLRACGRKWRWRLFFSRARHGEEFPFEIALSALLRWVYPATKSERKNAMNRPS